MIKLTVEITDDKFNYSYQIGEDTFNSSRHLCAESFVRFCDLLKICSANFEFQDRQNDKKILAQAMMESEK
jgi:hypothetical protein